MANSLDTEEGPLSIPSNCVNEPLGLRLLISVFLMKNSYHKDTRDRIESGGVCMQGPRFFAKPSKNFCLWVTHPGWIMPLAWFYLQSPSVGFKVCVATPCLFPHWLTLIKSLTFLVLQACYIFCLVVLITNLCMFTVTCAIFTFPASRLAKSQATKVNQFSSDWLLI